MTRRRLGSAGLTSSPLAFGCMGLTRFAEVPSVDEDQARAVIGRAVEAGVTMFDTADVYGAGLNEEVVGRCLAPYRDRVMLCSKFGQVREADGSRGVRGTPEHVRASCEASLRRLGVDTIDLYYQHRVDPDVPIEETVGAMAELVAEGKVRWLGLSEASAATIRRAHAVHPVSAVQSEYSLWSRGVEESVLPALRELGIGFVAYGALGRGFLAGAIRARDSLPPDDIRRGWPRFQGENLRRNLELLDAVERVAERLGLALPQVALAWVLAQGDDLVVLAGTTKVEHLETNLVACDVRLRDDEIAELRALLDEHDVAGERYPAALMVHLEE